MSTTDTSGHYYVTADAISDGAPRGLLMTIAGDGAAWDHLQPLLPALAASCDDSMVTTWHVDDHGRMSYVATVTAGGEIYWR